MIIFAKLLQFALRPGRKNIHWTASGSPAGHASSSRILEADSRVEADAGAMPNCPPTDDADMRSASNSEVRSAMNHQRRRAILRNGIFSEEAFDAFNSGDAYIHAA